MIETHLRSKIQPTFNSIGMSLAPHFTPTTLTIAALTSGFLSGFLVSIHYLLPALFFLLLSGLLDILDGTVARLTNNAQKIGAYMDLIGDRMVEVAIILGFAIAYPQYHLAYIIFLSAVIFHFSSFLAAGALFPNTGNKSMHYDKSAIERAEAFIVFSLMMIFPQHIYAVLMLLNGAIIFCGITRFKRVMQYAQLNP